MASMIIHSGRFPDSRNASTTSILLMILARFWPVASFRAARSSSDSFSRSMAQSSSLDSLCPHPYPEGRPRTVLWHPGIPSQREPAYTAVWCLRRPAQCSWQSRALSPGFSGKGPGSGPSGRGIPLKYQIWETGAASSICPIRSRRDGSLGDFHAAAVADHAFVADLFIFSTVTLPVLGRPEDPLAEQTVFFRFRVL